MMILIIEDNQLKRDRVREFLSSYGEYEVAEAGSYNSGIKLALAKSFDFMILDMSMPTFDRTESTNGGRFRAIAGKEIALRLKQLNRLIPFVVLTGYSTFSVNSENLSLVQIDELLQTTGPSYKGCVLYDAAESVWHEQLTEIIKGLH